MLAYKEVIISIFIKISEIKLVENIYINIINTTIRILQSLSTGISELCYEMLIDWY